MLALCVPFYVCSDVFSCSCFLFPSSLVNNLLQLTSVFPLIGLVLPLFILAFLVLLCFLLLLLFLLLLFFCCFFFWNCFCSCSFSSSFAPLAWGANCDGGVFPGCSGVFGFLSFWNRPSRMDLRQTSFPKKTFCPSCLGFSFGRPAS